VVSLPEVDLLASHINAKFHVFAVKISRVAPLGTTRSYLFTLTTYRSRTLSFHPITM
jgi:hypothetical protein